MCYHPSMRVVVGTVIDGKVVVDAPLEEGATVAVVTGETEPFDLDETAKQALLLALAEAEQGVLVDGKALLRELRS